MGSFGVELFALMAIISSSMCGKFVNEEPRWTVVRDFVQPLILSRYEERDRRSARSPDDDFAEDDGMIFVSIANWTLKTVRNDRLIVPPNLEIHWNHSEDPPRRDVSSLRHHSDCDVRRGHIVNDDDSVVVLTVCADEFYVVLSVDNRVLYVRPTANGRHVLEETRALPVYDKSGPETRVDDDDGVKDDPETESVRGMSEIFEKSRDHVVSLSNLGRTNGSNDSSNFSQVARPNVLETKLSRKKRRSARVCPSRGFYNLTGDTFDLESHAKPINVEDIDEESDDYDGSEEEAEKRDDEEELAVEEDTEHVGYFFDRTWEKTKLPKRKNGGSELPPRWLELGIAIDYSVIDFHGERVQHYILALLNIIKNAKLVSRLQFVGARMADELDMEAIFSQIRNGSNLSVDLFAIQVSAVYRDPSLDSNLKIVVVRMVFYAEKSDGMVRQGNARKSLENVNKWNRKLLSDYDENHDVAVWLTRLDIGGPSGYAPVSGACDPARSCALNRDEGLTSAFIIAHEVAHILGLTHDGDETAGNSCAEEASMGSVMAPMVAATFHRFHWSSCSRKEFHRRAKHFQCLDNEPSSRNSTQLRPTQKEAFTMDEQCRMEFGEGYGLCRSFDLPAPCSHLWCGHAGATQICKTKKGPPLEGTACGEDKWCINGYCDTVDRKRFGLGPVTNNPRDGGWNRWSSWGKCSRSCGIGVQYRFRQCNEPAPAYGGKYCEGNSEDFRPCEATNCSVRVDVRQQQCLRLPSLVGFDETSPQFAMTWLPHEADEDHLKCRLSCRASETGEIFSSQENLLDGAPCSYGATDICVQGTCREMGCDRVLNSEKRIDSCGVCDGDDSTCSRLADKFRRKIRRGMTRVSVVPRGSYNVSVEVTVERRSSHRGNVTFTIRDARRRRNDLTGFDSSGRGRTVIVEGAAFRSQKSGDTYEIWARGPVLSEVIVSLAVQETAVKRGVAISVVSRYIVNRNDSSAKGNYSWISGGWSSCSASCGGGTRHKTVACKDDGTGRIANRKKCSLLSKPIQPVEKCNIFSCRFKWIPGPWEGCTATCGNEGIQHRQIYCVHSSFVDDLVTKDNEVTVYRIMASPIRCKTDRPPENKRECNRSPCLGNWIFTNWSSCSRSCGKGIQSRMARCVSLNDDDHHQQQQQQQQKQNHECVGSSTPDQLRTCRGHGRRNSGCDYFCRRDRSKYCVLTILKRYCRLPGFRRQCCRSCLDDS